MDSDEKWLNKTAEVLLPNMTDSNKTMRHVPVPPTSQTYHNSSAPNRPHKQGLQSVPSTL